MSVILVRTLIMYILLLFIMRLMGKRQLGQPELSEFVLASLAADIAALPLQDLNIPLINALLPLLLLTALELLISYTAMKSPAFRSFLRGRPSILIENGAVKPEALRRNRFSTDELREALREKGCLDFSSVRCAVLETDGNLSLILLPSAEPPSAGELGLKSKPRGYPLTIISGGRVLGDNLSALGMSFDELNAYLQSKGISGPEGVFYMSMDEYKKIYIQEEEP